MQIINGHLYIFTAKISGAIYRIFPNERLVPNERWVKRGQRTLELTSAGALIRGNTAMQIISLPH